MRQAAGVFAAVLTVLLQEAVGCSILCNQGCRHARQLTWHRRTEQQCQRAGETVVLDPPTDRPATSSCDYGRVQGSQACEVEWNATSGRHEALCQAEGVCGVEWAVLSETCLCTPRPPGPCDGKCQDLPVCREGEQLARPMREWQCGADELEAGTCREAEVCCVASACRTQPAPVPVPVPTPVPTPAPVTTPVPVPARGCVTQCGRRVASGETVKGDGTDYCNTCTCLEGSLSCTEKACTERQDPVCLPKGRACGITVWGNLQVMDRTHECPDLTRCTQGQSYAGFRFSFCDEKPRLCQEVLCKKGPCPCRPTDRFLSASSITLDTELFTVAQARDRWTVQLPYDALGSTVKLWFGHGEDVPTELVLQRWLNKRLVDARVEGFSGEVLADSLINISEQAMMITLTPAAVEALSQGGILTLLDELSTGLILM